MCAYVPAGVAWVIRDVVTMPKVFITGIGGLPNHFLKLAIKDHSLYVHNTKLETAWCTTPTTNGGMQNGSSVGMCTRCVHVFCTFGADLCAQSVLRNKISASEFSRKFI